jgi:hypothetical protein
MRHRKSSSTRSLRCVTHKEWSRPKAEKSIPLRVGQLALPKHDLGSWEDDSHSAQSCGVGDQMSFKALVTRQDFPVGRKGDLSDLWGD